MARDIIFKTGTHNFSEFLYTIEDLDYTVIAQGKQKRWDGVGDAGFYGDFDKLISTIGYNFDDVTISEEKGHLYIDALDHDGWLSFEVKKVNDKGIEYFEKWQEKWNMNEKKCHENIFKRMAVLPRLMKVIRGIEYGNDILSGFQHCR